jgi:hypothetical protein
MENLLFPYLACLIIGALGGFAAGFRLAAMVRLGPTACDGEATEDFA